MVRRSVRPQRSQIHRAVRRGAHRQDLPLPPLRASEIGGGGMTPHIEAPPDVEQDSADRVAWQSQPADAQTVKARAFTSDVVAALLSILDKTRPGMGDGGDFPFEDEALRVYLTMIELGKRAEIQADKMGIVPGRVRRFYCPDYIAELHYRRQTQNYDLAPELKEKERRRLARAWRLRFARVIHARQCRNHFAFVERERREKRDKREATVYVDRLTDLVNEAARLIREKRGVPVKRAALAADQVLAKFIQTPEHVYAPDWTEATGAADEDSAPKGKATSDAPADPFEPIKKNLRRLVKDARASIEAQELSEDEADQVWMELHALIESERTNAPQPEGTPRRRSASRRPPVLSRGDIEEKPAAWLSEIVTPPARSEAAKGDLVGRSNVPLNSDGSQFFAGNLALAPSRDVENMECPEVAARLTVEAMQSVGADKFKIVYLARVPIGGQADCVGAEEVTAPALVGRVGELVARSERRGQSVTLRAWGGRLIQVDDCTADVMRRLLPFAFLAVETSPGNFQVWLALSHELTDEARRDVRGRLLRKFKERGEGANGGAYNSLRLPGCLNVKEKYQKALGHHPRVLLTHTAPGRICSPLELEQAGLLAAPVERAQPLAPPTTSKLPAGALPDYQAYLTDAGGDRSRADIRWSMAALGMGFPAYVVEQHLETLSGKAQGRRDDYARKTVSNAASFVAASTVTKQGRERVTL